MTRSPDPGVGMRILYPVQCWLIRPVRFNAPSAPALRELAAAAAGSPFRTGAGPLRLRSAPGAHRGTPQRPLCGTRNGRFGRPSVSFMNSYLNLAISYTYTPRQVIWRRGAGAW